MKSIGNDAYHANLFYNILMTKIFVGGLPYQTDDDQLQQIFSSYGEIASAKVITDRDSGRSKGFGFVEMADDASAQKAIAELHEAELGGRTKPQGRGHL
jgi:cold-inducible RNA-binding protein